MLIRVFHAILHTSGLIDSRVNIESKTMQSQIKLEINTGNGNTAPAANCGSINPAWQPLIDIAFGGQQIGDFNGQQAEKFSGQLDSAGQLPTVKRGTAMTGACI